MMKNSWVVASLILAAVSVLAPYILPGTPAESNPLHEASLEPDHSLAIQKQDRSEFLALNNLRIIDIPAYPKTTQVSYQDEWANYDRSAGQRRQQNGYSDPRSYPQTNPGAQYPVQRADYSQPTSSPLTPQIAPAGFGAGYPSQPAGPVVDAFGYDSGSFQAGNGQYFQDGCDDRIPSHYHFRSNSVGSNTCGCNDCMNNGYAPPTAAFKSIMAVDGYRRNPNREPRWGDADLLPWESLAYGEYIGPVRTPHMREYRVRVGDQIDFTFRQTREITQQAYRLGIGDQIAISSQANSELNDPTLTVLRDGTIQLQGIGNVLAANKTLERLQEEINTLHVEEGDLKESPKVIIKVIKSETQLTDLIRTVDATAGQGGTFRTLTVSPDGTVQLPALGSIPAIGLTLDELGAEANARYGMLVQGLEVTPSLRASAPTFAYVLGEANTPGQIQLNGPTTVMQLVARAGGWRTGANLREIVVFRRDENWKLIATKLDLSGAMWGQRPNPSDDLWVRNNDIILLPKTPAQRIVDFIDIYFRRGLYGVFPTQGFSVGFDGVSSL